MPAIYVDGHFFRVVRKAGFPCASGALLVQCGPVQVLKKALVLSIQPQLTQSALSGFTIPASMFLLFRCTSVCVL